MNIITSRHNSTVKDIRALKKRSARDMQGLAFIEGVRLIDEALSCGLIIRSIYLSESFSRGDRFGDIEAKAAAKRVRLTLLSDRVFEILSDTLNPQGLLAVIEMPDHSFSDLLTKNLYPRRLLILDRISDPGNVGAMLRTAEAAAFSGAVLSKGCVDIYEPKTLRAAMGAVFRIPFVRGADLTEVLSIIKRDGFRVYAAAPATAPDVVLSGNEPLNCFNDEFDNDDIAIIIGNEASGVRPELLSACDGILSIPMYGCAESLNAGVAAGILMYEFVRRGSIADCR